MKTIEGIDEPPDNKSIPLIQFIPKTNENRYFYENGLSPIIPKLKVKVHSDLEICYLLWEKFSPNNSLFNLWEFRYAWHQGFSYKAYFYTLYLGKKPVATLPLWFNEKDKRYEWFGGTWPEDNYFFTNDERFIPLLLKIAPSPIFLNAIVKETIKEKEVYNYLKEDAPKYILDLKGVRNIKEILIRLNKKSRHHLRYYLKNFLEMKPKIELIEGDQSNNLPELLRLSIIDFERKDISEYRKKERMKTFEMIYKNQGRYKTLTFFIRIQNHLAVYDIVGIYKKNFYILTGASDLQRFPGSGVFVTYLELEEAVRQEMGLVDCMQEDYRWKHKYFFPKQMLKFEKK